MTGYLLLSRDLGQAIAVPIWPRGVGLAPFSASIAPKVHALMLLSYAKGGGGVPAQFDRWWAMTRHDPEFDANLCVVATAGGEPVGFALCWSSAFIKDLVVRPDWRRRGLGTALLQRASILLGMRGHQRIELKVLADNIAARRVYAHVGFRDAAPRC